MNNTQSKIAVIIAILAVLIIGTFYVSTARANPPTFLRVAGTAAATTTVSYMSPGMGTTTVQYDAYSLLGTGEVSGNLFAQLAIQHTASSSAFSILNTYFEYSNDGVDWYSSQLSERATTTASLSIGALQPLTWTFASSTPGLGNVPSNSNRDQKIVQVPVIMRYIRAIFVVPIGASNSGVYAEWVGVKQR